MPLEIKIEDAKKLAKDLGYTEIVIYGYDKDSGVEHVTTYGISKEDSNNAADKGNEINRLMGWAEEYCHAKPIRTDF